MFIGFSFSFLFFSFTLHLWKSLRLVENAIMYALEWFLVIFSYQIQFSSTLTSNLRVPCCFFQDVKIEDQLKFHRLHPPLKRSLAPNDRLQVRHHRLPKHRGHEDQNGHHFHPLKVTTNPGPALASNRRLLYQTLASSLARLRRVPLKVLVNDLSVRPRLRGPRVKINRQSPRQGRPVEAKKRKHLRNLQARPLKLR